MPLQTLFPFGNVVFIIVHLCSLECQNKVVTHVFPPERGFAVLTVDVCDGVQASEEDSLLGRAAAHVHPAGREEQVLETSPLRARWQQPSHHHHPHLEGPPSWVVISCSSWLPDRQQWLVTARLPQPCPPPFISPGPARLWEVSSAAVAKQPPPAPPNGKETTAYVHTNPSEPYTFRNSQD